MTKAELEASLARAYETIDRLTRLLEAQPSAPPPYNMEQWAAQLEADTDDDDDPNQLTVPGLFARLEEVYGDGWQPPDPFGVDLTSFPQPSTDDE